MLVFPAIMLALGSCNVVHIICNDDTCSNFDS